MKKVLWVLTILLSIALMFLFDRYNYQTDKVNFMMDENHTLYSEKDTLMSFIESWNNWSWATVALYTLTNNVYNLTNSKTNVLCVDYKDKEYLYCDFVYAYVPRSELVKIK